MAGRLFSNAIQFSAVKSNLERNNGMILCELCKKQLFSIGECHFDHIVPYAKGGLSTLNNCQILCVDCNLKKSDKELKDIALEERARQFLNGKVFDRDTSKAITTPVIIHDNNMTKEKFDQIVQDYIIEKGNIRQIDFSREYNHLPGISYVIKYYGTLNEMKKAFGITDISLNWNRENIAEALKKFASTNGKITQKDIKKENGLPSIECMLKHYPEYKNFTEIKRGLCNITTRNIWTKETAIIAGKHFACEHDGKLTQKDCHSSNGLPPMSVIYRLFGDMPTYQKTIGSVVSKNNFVSTQDVEKAVEAYFCGKERLIESRESFFQSFPYSIDVIRGRYNSFDDFARHFNITVIKNKRAKYTRQEVDNIISEYIKTGKPIPNYHDLSKEGLPAASTIMRYYEHWREPFEIFQTLYKKIGN